MSFRIVDVNVAVADRIDQLPELARPGVAAKALECKTGGSWICVGPTTNITCVGTSVRLSLNRFVTRLSLKSDVIDKLRGEIQELVNRYAKG